MHERGIGKEKSKTMNKERKFAKVRQPGQMGKNLVKPEIKKLKNTREIFYLNRIIE